MTTYASRYRLLKSQYLCIELHKVAKEGFDFYGLKIDEPGGQASCTAMDGVTTDSLHSNRGVSLDAAPSMLFLFGQMSYGTMGKGTRALRAFSVLDPAPKYFGDSFAQSSCTSSRKSGQRRYPYCMASILSMSCTWVPSQD
jgi:hypothetical protein